MNVKVSGRYFLVIFFRCVFPFSTLVHFLTYIHSFDKNLDDFYIYLFFNNFEMLV